MEVDWRGELRTSAVNVAAIIACFFTGWLIEDLAGLNTDVVILAVVLALQIGRRTRDTTHRHRLMMIALLPAVSAAAGGVAVLMRDHIVVGDVLYTVVISGAIWIRRFGPAAARAGTLATLPLLAMLIAPAATGSAGSHIWWNAVIAAMVIAWVTVLQYAAEHLGLVSKTDPHQADVGSTRPPRRTESGMRPAASTRMAIQMGITLGAAFLIGHQVYGLHWTWVVLTAYIVPGGNRGRGDVIHKGILRVGGAALGTIAATLLANTFSFHDHWAVVAIIATLSVASWLRNFGYAYWAAAATASLAFLYGYFGETSTSLLHTRLIEIVIGAALAIAVAWFVFPVRTTDVVRRRSADALANLTEYVVTARSGDVDGVAAQDRRVGRSISDLRDAAVPIQRYRHIVERDARSAHTAGLVRQVVAFRDPVKQLTSRIVGRQADPLDAATTAELDRLHRQVVSARRELGATKRKD